MADRIFRLAAEGLGPQAIQTRLHDEGTPSPTGDPLWPRRTLEQILRSDLYKAPTFKEIAELVSAEVLTRLDEHAEYGVWWFGRKRTTEHSISEPDGNGGRHYRKATTTRIRPKEELTAVPVPAHLPRGLVDQARGSGGEQSAGAKAPSTEVGTAWAPALLVRLDYDHPHRDFTRQRCRLSLLRVQPTQGPWAGV